MVHICADCVQACAVAVRAESNVREARASQAPPPSEAQWAPFSQRGKTFHWRVVPSVMTTVDAALVVELRGEGAQGVVQVYVRDTSEVDEDIVNAAASWLLEPPDARVSQDPEEPSEWQTLDLGVQKVQWRAKRIPQLQVARIVELQVRDPSSGEVQSLDLPAGSNPTVDDAAMALTWE